MKKIPPLSVGGPEGILGAVNFDTWLKIRVPDISPAQAAAVLKLAEEGGTVPFIARYRKEQTGNLDEVGIRAVIEAKEVWDEILKRQSFIVGEIDKQKKLTDELKNKILATFDLDRLEDLYLPYKLKRRTKAMIARDAGLAPLADWIWNTGHGTETPEAGQTLEIWAHTYINEKMDVKTAQDAIQGAQDILVERLAETAELREHVRRTVFDKAFVRGAKGKKAKPHSKFEPYFEYSERLASLNQPQNSHRYLALRRGWMEEEISLTIAGAKPEEDEAFERSLLAPFEAAACTVPDAPGAALLMKAARLALKAHVLPSIDAEVHKALKQTGDETAIRVFAENVRKLLLAAPYGSKAVLGVDPGVRSGCKLAVIGASGELLFDTVIHVQTEIGKKEAAKLVAELVKRFEIRAVAVGNGTAGRETEVFLRQALKDSELAAVPVVMVSESGASVYSASDVAREEFPDKDVTVRGAVSIARRLQDPLAELVKIDPKSIGVGQYQHDVAQNALKKSLEEVVDSCVNAVGVDLNTASYHLLAHVSGIGPALAKAIVAHRVEKGLFKKREELLNVTRFSAKSFEQAAGFLKIPGGENPLDNTGVHPERYPLLEEFAKSKSVGVDKILGDGVALLKGASDLREKIGAFTFDDIVKELEKPGRDPRDVFVAFSYREDIQEVKDLQVDMVCPGIVTNVTNFGAFVDIGVHQDGLVHLSQLADRFVKDPREVVSPGDHVKVKVMAVDLQKNQISLSMKGLNPGRGPKAPDAPAPRAPRAERDVGGAHGGSQREGGRPSFGGDRGGSRPGDPRGPGGPGGARGPGAPRGPGGPGGAPGRPPMGGQRGAPGGAFGGGRPPEREPRFGGVGGGGGKAASQNRGKFANNPFAALAELKKDLKK
jgi:uncharacterized protein